MHNDVEIVTKSDKNFFKGLKALLESLEIFAPTVKRSVIDCGLTKEQLLYCKEMNCDIQKGNISGYQIQESMQHYYTPAIYGFINSRIKRNKIIIHIDADAILLGDLETLITNAKEHGLSAVPDYPNLCLSDQIKNESCIASIKDNIPKLDLKSVTFNAGVFAVRSEYYLDKMLPIIKKLIPLHNKLWSNDQALLNLSAFAVNPHEPFRNAGYKFNTRPRYSRSPNTPPLKLIKSKGGLQVEGIDGLAHVLHYVSKPKPWEEDYDKACPGYLVWSFYYGLGKKII